MATLMLRGLLDGCAKAGAKRTDRRAHRANYPTREDPMKYPEVNDYRVLKLREKRWAAQRWDGHEWLTANLFARQSDAKAWVRNIEAIPASADVPARHKHPRERESQ